MTIEYIFEVAQAWFSWYFNCCIMADSRTKMTYPLDLRYRARMLLKYLHSTRSSLSAVHSNMLTWFSRRKEQKRKRKRNTLMSLWKRADTSVSSTEAETERMEDFLFLPSVSASVEFPSFTSPWKQNTTQTEAQGKDLIFVFDIPSLSCLHRAHFQAGWHNWHKSFSACASIPDGVRENQVIVLQIWGPVLQ